MFWTPSRSVERLLSVVPSHTREGVYTGARHIMSGTDPLYARWAHTTVSGRNRHDLDESLVSPYINNIVEEGVELAEDVFPEALGTLSASKIVSLNKKTRPVLSALKQGQVRSFYFRWGQAENEGIDDVAYGIVFIGSTLLRQEAKTIAFHTSAVQKFKDQVLTPFHAYLHQIYS